MALDQQEKRTAKGQSGLATGMITVTPDGVDRWHVRNGDGVRHLVTRTETAQWWCDCEDFGFTCVKHNPELRCYHIEAVRLQDSAAQQAAQMKGETKNMTEPTTNCGWVKMFHPSGVQVTIPLPLESALPSASARAMFDSLTTLLQAGWLVNMPGLEDGERVDEIKHIVRRAKANEDGSETPVIDLYPDRANFRILGIYLNTEQDIQAFEQVAGVKLRDLPLYEGDNAIERGKGAKTDKYVIALKSPVKVVFKANPKWEGDEDKKHPKRIFVRWMTAQTSDPAANGSEAKPASAAPTTAAGNNNGNGHGKGDETTLPSGSPTLTLLEALEMTTPKGVKIGDAEMDLLVKISNFKPQGETPAQAKLRQAASVALTYKHAAQKATAS
jgi:hypothetical protein